MVTRGGERRYRIGVICDTPSIQVSAQYDSLADLAEFEFVMLLRSPKHVNPAWSPRPPTRVSFEVLKQSRFFPKRARPFLNVQVSRVLSRYDFDALILHGIYDSLAIWKGIWWCRRHRRPYLLRCDGNIEKERNKPGSRRLRRKLARKNIRGAAALLAIGEQNCKYYRFLGGEDRQLFMAPWEIDYGELEAHLAKARPRRAELRVSLGVSERVVVSSIGRLTPEKAFPNAMAAVARLVNSGLPVSLLIAGEGPFRAELEKLAGAAPPGAVRLVGNLTREGVVELLVSSDVFVMPSRAEAWGLVINEAALAGLPIVASDQVGAGTDLIAAERSGFIHRASDVDQLCELLRRLVEAKELRMAMGLESRRILDDWRRRFPIREGYRQALYHTLGLGRPR
jgi:glycosyltransferase involved in cell wall biosynthesis